MLFILKEKSLADFSLNLKYLKNYFKYIKHVELTKMWKKVEFCKKLIRPLDGHLVFVF